MQDMFNVYFLFSQFNKLHLSYNHLNNEIIFNVD